METFSDRLAFALKRRGWTPYQLQKHAPLPAGQVYRFLDGTRPSMEIETLRRIADALGVTCDWLVAGREPMMRPDAAPPVPPPTSGAETTPAPPKSEPRRSRTAR